MGSGAWVRRGRVPPCHDYTFAWFSALAIPFQRKGLFSTRWRWLDWVDSVQGLLSGKHSFVQASCYWEFETEVDSGLKLQYQVAPQLSLSVGHQTGPAMHPSSIPFLLTSIWDGDLSHTQLGSFYRKNESSFPHPLSGLREVNISTCLLVLFWVYNSSEITHYQWQDKASKRTLSAHSLCVVFVCVVWSTENGGLLRFSFSSIEDGELHRTIHIKSYADAVTWTFVVRFFSRSTVRVVRRSCTLQLPINFPINRKGGLYITRAMKPISLHRWIRKSLWLI